MDLRRDGGNGESAGVRGIFLTKTGLMAALLISVPAAAQQAPTAEVRGLREGYRALIPGAGPPDKVAQVRTIAIAGAKDQPVLPARVYVPLGSKGPLPTLLYLHGGGWASGDFDTTT